MKEVVKRADAIALANARAKEYYQALEEAKTLKVAQENEKARLAAEGTTRAELKCFEEIIIVAHLESACLAVALADAEANDKTHRK